MEQVGTTLRPNWLARLTHRAASEIELPWPKRWLGRALGFRMDDARFRVALADMLEKLTTFEGRQPRKRALVRFCREELKDQFHDQYGSLLATFLLKVVLPLLIEWWLKQRPE